MISISCLIIVIDLVLADKCLNRGNLGIEGNSILLVYLTGIHSRHWMNNCQSMINALNVRAKCTHISITSKASHSPQEYHRIFSSHFIFLINHFLIFHVIVFFHICIHIYTNTLLMSL